MASLYKNGRHYYVSVSYKGTRRSISTGTSDKRNALALKSKLERNLLQDIIVGKPKVSKQYSLKDLMEKFLNSERDWKESTKSIYKYSFKRYLKSGFPDTSYKAMIVRNLNTMYKWAYENGYIDKSIKYEGGNRWESRHRVINNDELEILFKEVSDDRFNKFIRFFTKRCYFSNIYDIVMLINFITTKLVKYYLSIIYLYIFCTILKIIKGIVYIKILAIQLKLWIIKVRSSPESDLIFKLTIFICPPNQININNV